MRMNGKSTAVVIVFLLIICVGGYAQIPPATWQEHWFEHVQLLNRVFYDDDVAIYYDTDTPNSITWPNKYFGDVSRYVKKVYGPLSPENRIYIILHTNKYSGGHPSYYYDASHDNRNVADNGPGPWTTATYDLCTHEIGHIVESTPYGMKNSPAFGLWGDSKWCEIFIYDVYKGLGMTSEVTRWYNNCVNQTLDQPVAGAHWFRDWFYPLYTQYGGSAFLARFFENLGKNWKGGGLNWGQYVHFESCAAGADLRPAFKQAFGAGTWTAAMDSQYVQAQKAYPCLAITYSKNSPGPEASVLHGTVDAYPNPFSTRLTVRFNAAVPGNVSIHAFTLSGEKIKTIFCGDVYAGIHTVEWNGAGPTGTKLPAGVYLLKLAGPGISQVVKVHVRGGIQ
jgi:hypothetical protein